MTRDGKRRAPRLTGDGQLFAQAAAAAASVESLCLGGDGVSRSGIGGGGGGPGVASVSHLRTIGVEWTGVCGHGGGLVG